MSAETKPNCLTEEELKKIDESPFVDFDNNSIERAKKSLEMLRAEFEKDQFVDMGVMVTPNLIIHIPRIGGRYYSTEKADLMLRGFQRVDDFAVNAGVTITIALNAKQCSRLRNLLKQAEETTKRKQFIEKVAESVKRYDERHQTRRGW